MIKSTKFLIGGGIGVLVIGVISYLAYYQPSKLPQFLTPAEEVATSSSLTATSSPVETVERLDNLTGVTFPFDSSPVVGTKLPPLGLFTGVSEENDYSAGFVTDGRYKGLRRIVGLACDMGCVTHLFAVLPSGNYIELIPEGLPVSGNNNPSGLSPKIVDTIADPTFPPEIKVNDNFKLVRGSAGISVLLDDYVKDLNDYDVTPAPSLGRKDLTFYFVSPKEKINAQYESSLSVQDRKNRELRHTYLAGQLGVAVKDVQGLMYLYSFTHIDAPISSPYANFSKEDTTLPADSYKKYDWAFPGGCGFQRGLDITKNISDSDLVSVGRWGNIDLYELKNKNHPLNQFAYYVKTYFYDSSNYSAWGYDNKDKPTFDNYVSRHPLLFYKDPWGHLLILQEHDYDIPGGCGKPVIYLYPSKPTAVNVSFVTPMHLTTDIPTYVNGWSVLAQPNGILTDLQPEKTDCAKIDTAKKGSEYAATSCLTKTYPYLYWAGRSLANEYPEPQDGFIVERGDVASFMNAKLDEVGLTKKEKDDMLSYWLPRMLESTTPYYRIAFLQTEEMNRFIPMNISPKPDHYYRIFLDYLPLVSKPSVSPLPQKLVRWILQGFTAVEWGGLER